MAQDSLTSPGLTEGDSIGEFVANEIVDGVSRTRRVKFAKAATQLAASGPLADRLNASSTGLLFNDPALLPNTPSPGAKAEIRGSGSDLIDGYYAKTGAAGQPGWARRAGLDTAAVTGLTADVGTLMTRAPILLTLSAGSTGDALVCTGGYTGNRNQTGRTYVIPAPPQSNAGTAVTLSIDGEAARPLNNIRNVWAPGLMPTLGHMLVVAGTNGYRVLSGLGAVMSEAQLTEMKQADIVYLGEATLDESSGSSVYKVTTASDVVGSTARNQGRRFSFFVKDQPTNAKANPVLRINDANTFDMRGPYGEQIKAGGMPVKAQIHIDGVGTQFFITAPFLGGGVSADLSAILDRLAALEGGTVTQATIDEMDRNWQAIFAETEELVADMDGAVVTAKGVLAPDRPGEFRWGSRIALGDLETAIAAQNRIPASWLDKDADLGGACVLLDGAQIGGGQSSLILRRPDLRPLYAGRKYQFNYAFKRRDAGSNPGGDKVQIRILFLDFNKALISSANVFDDVVATGQVRSSTRAIEWAAGAGVTVIPAGACYAVLLAEAFGGTAKTLVGRLALTDVTDAGPGTDTNALNTRVTTLEGAAPGYATKALSNVTDADVSAAVDRGVRQSQVDKFTSSATWTKPAWATRVAVYLISGGNGGGSGSVQASGVAAAGGSGAAPAAYVEREFRAADLPATVSVTVGAGGAGGAAQAVASSTGNDGVAGGNSSFGTLLYAKGSSVAVGKGGSTAAVTGGSISPFRFFPPVQTALTGGTGAVGVGTGGIEGFGVFGSGAGGAGGVSTTNVSSAGGPSGASAGMFQSTLTAAGGAAGGGAGGAATAPPDLARSPVCGGGGGGGGAHTTDNGGAGGAGAIPGGAGGGGGATRNGFSSGKGGDGARGEVWVVSYR